METTLHYIIHYFYINDFCFDFRSSKLSFRVLLSEASVALSDDITSPSRPVELLRLTLTKLLLSLSPAPTSLPPELTNDPCMETVPISALMPDGSLIEVYCSSLQVDNQLYNQASFHFPVLLCQDQRGGADPKGPWSSDANPTQSPETLEEFKRSCFLQLRMTLAEDKCTVEEVGIIHLSFYLHFYFRRSRLCCCQPAHLLCIISFSIFLNFISTSATKSTVSTTSVTPALIKCTIPTMLYSLATI